jgi:Trypsin-like peptidase domain
MRKSGTSKHFAMKLLSLIVLVAGVAAAQLPKREGSVPGVPPGLIATPIKPTPAQPPPARKDIPAIAKAANGAIVIVITAAGDKPIAQGTGFLVSADGVIVTNYHVIKEGNVAIVKFPDGTVLPVDGVLAADKVRDLAVIKIHGKSFRTLTLGNSDQVQVGEEVVAIGNPLGLELTVSNGIVSGLRTDKSGKFLQTTAPISPGSSGGPLFNMRGEVVGINTMYLAGGENLNFAIPVNEAKLLLSNQSTNLKSLPNEVEKETHGEASPELPLVGQTSDSPAYRQYQELLKANDLTVSTGIYACFYDSKERIRNFFVMDVTLFNKNYMQALVNNFTDGVLGDTPLIFAGKIQSFSSEQGIFADLPTSYDNKHVNDSSHKKDVFHWTSGDVAIEAGWGELTQGQVRMGYKFRLQHSTGRFVEDTTLVFPGTDPSSTIHEPGRCIRIPNIIMTPEEEYKVLANDVEKTPVASATPNNSLPPNTKMAAESEDSSITSEQVWENAKYCYRNPANRLKASDGELVDCSEVNAIFDARVKACKSKGPKANPENCKGFLKGIKDLKAGRL